MKSTREAIVEARKHIIDTTLPEVRLWLSVDDTNAISVLLAATDEPASEPRPADMAELARLVAKMLRRRGIHATVTHSDWGNTVAVPKCDPLLRGNGLRWQWHPMSRSEFDNLTPSEIVDAIQVEEAKKAAEWAGDE